MRIDKIEVPQGFALDGLKFTESSLTDIANIGKEFADDITYLELPSHKDSLGVVKISDEYLEKSDLKAECGKGVEIEGFLFLPEEIKGNESYRRRSFQRTKIMSGGEFVSRTTYIPREYSFTTWFDIESDEPYHYDKIFTMMENKKCKVISPYISTNTFYAAVEIQKTHPKGMPNTMKVDVKLTEIPSAHLEIEGDKHISYPRTDSISNIAIQEKKEEDDSSSSDDSTSGRHRYHTVTGNFARTS